jgi:sporulation-control protein spo0M
VATAVETYLRVTFQSEGAKPSEVAGRLQEFGFVPTQGNYDFVYDWRGAGSKEQVLDLVDEVTRLLRGYRVLFEVETV